MKKTSQTITMILLLLLSASFAVAAGQVSLEITAQEEVEIINEDGEKEIMYIAPESVIPGDVVLYTIHYHNHGTEPAEAVVITNPIPEHMQFINEMTFGSETTITFSIDDGNSFDTVDKLFIPTENGNQRLATVKDYTHIQWRLNNLLNPNSTGAVGYLARLE